MWNLAVRVSLYAVVAAATVPIVGAYDFGSYVGDSANIWTRLIVSVGVAVIITAIGEAGLRLAKRHPRR